MNMSTANPWDDYGTSKKAENPFEQMPSDIDLGRIAPVFGVNAPTSGGAEYLDINIGGRSFSQQLFYNTGTSYLAGILAGGSYGALEGLRNAPSHKFKIRMNSLLNASGKRGSRTGNALGTLGMYETFCLWSI